MVIINNAEKNASAMNRIIQGDTIEEMRKLDDNSVDMILADLPYGTTRNRWDSIIDLEALWLEYDRVIKLNGAVVLTAQTPFDKVLGVSNLRNLRYEWIRRKPSGTGHLNAKRMPMKNHENILVFYKRLPTYNPQFTVGKAYVDKSYRHSSNYNSQQEVTHTVNDGYRYPMTVQNFNAAQGFHPTQKPVALFEYLIRTYANEGDVVLDNVIGSGTTAVAAINTGRNFIGIEREQEYVDIARRRIDEACGVILDED